MIVDDLYVVSAIGPPDEADPPLVVNAGTMLTLAFPPERFQPVAGRDAAVAEGFGMVDHIQLPSRHLGNWTEVLRQPPTLEEGLSIFASEAFYHSSIRSTYSI